MSWDKKEILKFAKYIKNNKANNTVKLDEKNYILASVIQVLCSYILDNTKNDYSAVSIQLPTNPSGDNINTNVTKADYIDAIKRCYNYQNNNKQAPNYIRVSDKYNVKYQLFAYSIAKIVVWMFENDNKYPNYVTINNKDIEIVTPKNDVYTYFCQIFNKKPKTIDECLQIINNKGYSHYYNDRYTNKETINRIRFGQGVNCTDACHLFWNLGKALDYDVKCIHVKCSGGDGHVRLQFKHPKYTNGNWINRDPACVLSNNGNAITCNWCLNGQVLAVNPSWWMNDVLK